MTRSDYKAQLGRRFLWLAQGGICHICGQALPQRFGSPLLTIDHVWPRSRAAAMDRHTGNTLLAHLKCNQAKADRTPTGCEVLMLFAANRFMRLGEGNTAHWDRYAMTLEARAEYRLHLAALDKAQCEQIEAALADV